MPILPRAALAAIFAVSLGTGSALAGSLDDTPRIAVISAYEPEWVALQTPIAGRSDHVEHGIRFVTGTLEGEDVVLLLSGVGMVNAAMTAQMALDRYNISAIVFSGIAGGVDPALNIGDVVVADRWGTYFNLLLAREVDGSYQIPPFLTGDFPNYGMMFAQPEEVRRDGVETPEAKFWFEVDPALLARAQKAADAVDLVGCNAKNSCLEKAPAVYVGGSGVSGSAFLDNADFRDFVFDTFKARVVDMESASVAQVAYTNGVPFIAFRSLSDLAGGGEGENELPLFFSLAAENSAALVREFLKVSDAAGENGPARATNETETQQSKP